jgi:hypothetical protein
MDGAWGVTSALIGIENWQSECSCLLSDGWSGGAAPVPVGDDARVRGDVREEYVPVICAFGGTGEGDGAER